VRRRDLHRRPHLHPPTSPITLSAPENRNQRNPHRCLGCTRSVHEDILAGGRVIPTPALTCFRYAHALSAHASILGFPTTLLTPSCGFPHVPQSRNSRHISLCFSMFSLRMDIGPCGTLTVATVEVSPFTLLAPLVAEVPRPSEPNLRIHSQCVVLPRRTS